MEPGTLTQFEIAQNILICMMATRIWSSLKKNRLKRQNTLEGGNVINTNPEEKKRKQTKT